jgi:hypothetical protein
MKDSLWIRSCGYDSGTLGTLCSWVNAWKESHTLAIVSRREWLAKDEGNPDRAVEDGDYEY